MIKLKDFKFNEKDVKEIEVRETLFSGYMKIVFKDKKG